jgi:hypothetical protein
MNAKKERKKPPTPKEPEHPLSPPEGVSAPPSPREPAKVPYDVEYEIIENLHKQYREQINSINTMWRNEVTQLHMKMEEQRINSITEQLWIWIKDCKQRRNAYWKLYYSYDRWNNTISVPLLLISSATGISSVVQLGDTIPAVKWTVAVLGVGSTALAAFQRYFRYGEKAEQCKAIAKRYALLARKGELQANLYETKNITIEELVKFMEDFRKDLDGIQQETDDMPKEILDRVQVTDPKAGKEQIRQEAMNEDGKQMDRNEVRVQMVAREASPQSRPQTPTNLERNDTPVPMNRAVMVSQGL